MNPSTASTDTPGAPVRHALAAAGLWFLLALTLLVGLRRNETLLAGSDPYYHLRFAAEVLEHGIGTHELPWLRFSIFREHWGDKEFLFRLFLLPFVGGEDPIQGGLLALSVLNALQAALIGFIGVRWFGKPGALLPILLLGVNTALLPRLNLLRPHNLSMPLLLLATYFVERRAYRRLGLTAAAYTLAYTAAQTLPLLCAGLFFLIALFRKEKEWGLLVYPPLGFLFGFLLHPAFPHNLLIWRITNINFYKDNEAATLGTEIFPLTSAQFLLYSSMSIFLFVAALLVTRPWQGAPRLDRRELILGGLAMVFTGLAILAYRFVEYGAPFGMLYAFALFHRLHANPEHPPRHRRIRSVLMPALLGYAVIVNVMIASLMDVFETRTRYFGDPADARAFAAALPDAARVAARWDTTAQYCFAAPHALFLSVVDPIYMHANDPAIFRIATDLFAGIALDPVEIVRGPLESDYVAHIARGARLSEQLREDPRASIVFENEQHVLFHLHGDGGFVVDWDLAISGERTGDEWPVAPPAGAFAPGPAATQPYRAYVSPAPSTWPGQLADDQREVAWCARRTLRVDEPETRWIGFTSLGPAIVYLDGEEIVQSSGTIRPWRGEIRFPLPLTPDREHELLICVMPGRNANGFFWREADAPFPPARFPPAAQGR